MVTGKRALADQDGGGPLTENVNDVAASILERLGTIDTWRLQKLVYYSQAWHLARFGEPLFDDEIQAFANGPVVRHLYETHKGVFAISRWSAGSPERLGARSRDVIDWVLDRYGSFSGDRLSRMTHAEAPWKLARGGIPESAPSNAPIEQSVMATYYGRLLMSPGEATAMAIGNARLEGYEFDSEAVQRLGDVATGKQDADSAVAEVVARYRESGRQ
jgi:uncharacterized phage-associated protein